MLKNFLHPFLFVCCTFLILFRLLIGFDRGWIGYFSATASLFIAGFIVLTRYFSNRDKAMIELRVIAPPPMTTMEQLLAVQNAISQLEQLVQDSNIVLLKFRALLLSLFPQVFLSSLEFFPLFIGFCIRFNVD